MDVVGDDDDLTWSGAEGRRGGLPLANGHRSLRIGQFDDAFENAQGRPVPIDPHRPVGASDGGGRGRRLDIDLRPAAGRARKDLAGL